MRAKVLSNGCACAGHASAVPEMNGVMTEIEDYLSYVGDILEVASARLRAEVSRKFWDGFVEPAVIAPLLAAHVRFTSELGVCCDVWDAVSEPAVRSVRRRSLRLERSPVRCVSTAWASSACRP
jgi:hypothetical protein